MSGSFLAATATRADDQRLPPLSSEYAALAEAMPPLARSLVVYNADPQTCDAQKVLNELELVGWYADEPGLAVESVPALLTADECAAARLALDDAARQRAEAGTVSRDSVDDAPDFQLSLTKEGLTTILGAPAVEKMWAQAARCRDEMRIGMHVPGTWSGRLPEAHEIFIRRYSPLTRPWFPFHADRSKLSLNVALSDGHVGGSLLAIYDGVVRRVPRAEGCGTLHPSALLHAVTRLCGGAPRYSLIVFFGQVCPHAPEHELVLVDSDCMRRLYEPFGGEYHCNACKRSSAEMGWPSMHHCKSGCEWDLCAACAPAHAPAGPHNSFVGDDCTHLPDFLTVF